MNDKCNRCGNVGLLVELEIGLCKWCVGQIECEMEDQAREDFADNPCRNCGSYRVVDGECGYCMEQMAELAEEELYMDDGYHVKWLKHHTQYEV